MGEICGTPCHKGVKGCHGNLAKGWKRAKFAAEKPAQRLQARKKIAAKNGDGVQKLTISNNL